MKNYFPFSLRFLVALCGYRFVLCLRDYDVTVDEVVLVDMHVGKTWTPYLGFRAAWRDGLHWETWLKGKRRAWMLRGPVIPTV